MGGDVFWTLGDCAILLEDAVGLHASQAPGRDRGAAAPGRDRGAVRAVIVAIAGLKAAASSGEDDELGEALWLARTLALDAADACRAASSARLERCAALCARAALACEAGIRERARRP